MRFIDEQKHYLNMLVTTLHQNVVFQFRFAFIFIRQTQINFLNETCNVIKSLSNQSLGLSHYPDNFHRRQAEQVVKVVSFTFAARIGQSQCTSMRVRKKVVAQVSHALTLHLIVKVITSGFMSKDKHFTPFAFTA